MDIKWIFSLAILLIFTCFSEIRGRIGFGSGNQEWGYAIIRKKINFFWWFYYANPSEKPSVFNPLDKPLLIWLGYFSTAVANFEQYGPMDVNLHPRNYSLVNDYNILYIDSMVGAGFSYVENNSLYPKNINGAAENLLLCIEHIFHDLQSQTVATYIVAESFHGRIAVELATIWFSKKKLKKLKLDLKGLILGNPGISTVDIVQSWARFLKKKKIISKMAALAILKEVKHIRRSVQINRFQKAFNQTSNLLDIILYSLPDQSNLDSFVKLHINDLLDPIYYNQLDDLMNNKVKTVLGLQSNWGLTTSHAFYKNIRNEIMKPTVLKFEKLLGKKDFEVALLNTQLDLDVSIINTLNWMKKIRWRHKETWRNIDKVPIKINEQIEVGYVKEYKDFHQYIFKNTKNLNFEDKAKILKIIIDNMTASEENVI